MEAILFVQARVTLETLLCQSGNWNRIIRKTLWSRQKGLKSTSSYRSTDLPEKTFKVW